MGSVRQARPLRSARWIWLRRAAMTAAQVSLAHSSPTSFDPTPLPKASSAFIKLIQQVTVGGGFISSRRLATQRGTPSTSARREGQPWAECPWLRPVERRHLGPSKDRLRPRREGSHRRLGAERPCLRPAECGHLGPVRFIFGPTHRFGAPASSAAPSACCEGGQQRVRRCPPSAPDPARARQSRPSAAAHAKPASISLSLTQFICQNGLRLISRMAFGLWPEVSQLQPTAPSQLRLTRSPHRSSSVSAFQPRGFGRLRSGRLRLRSGP